MMRPVTVIGDVDTAGGVYVLRIHVAEPISVAFGGFNGGVPVGIEAGSYVYTGSARARRSQSSLASRLIRHATRSGELPPHAIRPAVVAAFDELGIWNGRLPSGKKLFWNVDHLLDPLEVEIDAVLALRTSDRREGDVARLIEDDPRTSYILKGLGANDAPGNTHLLCLDASDGWWESLPERLMHVVGDPAQA